ncbi:MAG: SUMF1/EgtB/PvdO family nonheme iron enzyme [Candidatus Sumerlaeia bacterium]|nr:SUMF1/EgtB/PvdO family nonheme iron enzyme [Candidatus Sumerlaeia bacterium]
MTILGRFLHWTASALCTGALVLATTAAQAQQTPFSVPEGVGTIDIPDIGPMPKEIIWNADGARMVLIPGGEYRIGLNNPAERGFTRYEGPEVVVRVGAYYIDKFEVNYQQYMSIADAAGLNKPRTTLNPTLLSENHPIIAVSHDSAAQYARVMRKELPTEVEWEVAARGPDAFIYPWGNEARPGAAVLAMGARGVTRPVGSNPDDVSPFGVHDMAGNVAEWCADMYQRDFYVQVADKTNPVISEGSETRAVRGGDYYNNTDGRATIRTGCVSTHTRDEIGFRTVFRLRPAPKATPTPTPPPPRPTPTPRPEEVFLEMKDSLLQYFVDPTVELPEPIAGPFAQTRPVPFLNMSPLDLKIGFLDPSTRRLLRQFPSPLAGGRYHQLNVPRDVAVLALAYADHGTFKELVNLGPVNTRSNPFVIIPPHAFNRVTYASGRVMEPGPGVESEQHYGPTFTPPNNQFLIHNSTDLPVEIKVRRGNRVLVTQLVEPNESFVVDNLRPGENELWASYVGATDDKTSNSIQFRNDAAADFRIFTMRQGAEEGTSVHVVTRRVPLIAIRQHDLRVAGTQRDAYVVGERRTR